MADGDKIGLGTRLMALGCRICPFCIAARTWPNSSFAKKMHALEKVCPWCKAYGRLHGADPDAEAPTEA